MDNSTRVTKIITNYNLGEIISVENFNWLILNTIFLFIHYNSMPTRLPETPLSIPPFSIQLKWLIELYSPPTVLQSLNRQVSTKTIGENEWQESFSTTERRMNEMKDGESFNCNRHWYDNVQCTYWITTPTSTSFDWPGISEYVCFARRTDRVWHSVNHGGK